MQSLVETNQSPTTQIYLPWTSERTSLSVDTRAAGHGQLGVTVEGPVEVTLNCRDMGNGTCDIFYLPTECGDYTVNITFNDRHILGSPFQALIFPTPNLDHVTVTGAGIELHGKVVGWTSLIVVAHSHFELFFFLLYGCSLLHEI